MHLFSIKPRGNRTPAFWLRSIGSSCAAFALGITLAAAQSAPRTTDCARVDKLLGQMTLREKIALIDGTREDPEVYQGQAGYLAGVPRLGIPGMRFADGPPGLLTRVPAQGMTATMGVAATFSRRLARENGATIGREARSLGIDVVLQPFVNIDRDLEFGRGYNTFGEDPFLSGEIAAAEIHGIQAQHVLAQVKHYVGYDSEAHNIFIGDQALHEVYVAPFDAAIRAGVSSIMCSYNRINGAFACGNQTTLTKILRDEIGFEGFVTSDWGAVHAVRFINAGLDMEMMGEPWPGHEARPGASYFDFRPVTPAAQPKKPEEKKESKLRVAQHLPEEAAPRMFISGDHDTLDAKKMPEALKDGTVTEETITRAARRVLGQMERFGLLDGGGKHAITPQNIDANARVLEETGEAAAVLLKNENGALPLKKDALASTVFIGPTAGQLDSIGIAGERSVGLPERQVSPLDATKKVSGVDGIAYAVADDMTGVPVPAELLSHEGKPGLVRSCGGETKTDAVLDATKKSGTALPPGSTCTWKGELRIQHAGEYWMYLEALGANALLRIDGEQVGRTGTSQGGIHGDILQANQDNAIPTTDGLDNVRRAVQLEAGQYAIEVEITPDSSKSPAQVRLNWTTPEQRKTSFDAAVAAARKAKTAVVFAWARVNPVFALPGDQDKLIEEVAAANPNTIVVLNTSQPVALPWIDKVKAVLQMWWPGDEGGWSAAHLLLGRQSPAGRLPVSWGRRLEDYPATDPLHPERSMMGVDGKTTFSEGVDVGYRWFDRQKTEPLFAFGHGLSYTHFEYSQLTIKRAADGGLEVSVAIRNAGTADSDEVPQIYLGAPDAIPAGVQFAVRTLAGFDRVHLKAGETGTVTLLVPLRQLQYWSAKNGKWTTATGKRMVSVGTSSRDLRLNETVSIQ